MLEGAKSTSSFQKCSSSRSWTAGPRGQPTRSSTSTPSSKCLSLRPRNNSPIAGDMNVQKNRPASALTHAQPARSRPTAESDGFISASLVNKAGLVANQACAKVLHKGPYGSPRSPRGESVPQLTWQRLYRVEPHYIARNIPPPMSWTPAGTLKFLAKFFGAWRELHEEYQQAVARGDATAIGSSRRHVDDDDDGTKSSADPMDPSSWWSPSPQPNKMAAKAASAFADRASLAASSTSFGPPRAYGQSQAARSAKSTLRKPPKDTSVPITNGLDDRLVQPLLFSPRSLSILKVGEKTLPDDDDVAWCKWQLEQLTSEWQKAIVAARGRKAPQKAQRITRTLGLSTTGPHVGDLCIGVESAITAHAILQPTITTRKRMKTSTTHWYNGSRRFYQKTRPSLERTSPVG